MPQDRKKPQTQKMLLLTQDQAKMIHEYVRSRAAVELMILETLQDAPVRELSTSESEDDANPPRGSQPSSVD